MSHSGLQAGAGTRRSGQARVVPLPSTGTQGRCLPEAPNPMIFNDRPWRAGPQAALPHLAVEWLQRRWAALLRTGTPRLNTIYIVAGLIASGVTERLTELHITWGTTSAIQASLPRASCQAVCTVTRYAESCIRSQASPTSRHSPSNSTRNRPLLIART